MNMNKEMQPNFPERKEMFDIVFLKSGVSDLSAAPSDFKRMTVEAADPTSAQYLQEVLDVKGYRVLFAVPPGVSTEPEIMARRREMEGPPVDRSKI